MSDRWLYQAKAEPPPGAFLPANAPVELDRWYVQHPPPVLRRSAHATRSEIAAPPPGALLPPDPEAIELDRWYRQQPEPVPRRPRVQHGAEIVEPFAPIDPPVEPDLSLWYQPASEPAWPRRRPASGFSVQPLEPSLRSDVVPVATWFSEHPGPGPRPQPAASGFLVEPFSTAVARPAALVRNVLYQVLLRAHETVTGSGFANVVTENNFNRRAVLSPLTTPPVTRASYSRQTIGGGGSVTLDLTSMPGTQQPINAGGLLSRFLLIINKSTSANLTVDTAASNAFEPFGAGNQPVFPPGTVVMMYTPAGLPIDGSRKNLKLSGTTAETADVALIAG